MMLRHALTIFRKELREILRDRRALFLTFILPVLLYPVLFLAMGQLEEFKKKARTSEPSRVGLAGATERFRVLLEQDPDFVVSLVEPDQELVEEGELDALVHFIATPGDTPDGPASVTVYFEGSRSASEGARERLDAVLEDYENDLLAARFAARGQEIDPRQLVTLVLSDLADSRERSIQTLGRLLPMILVVLLLTGGSFAAIDLVAGEKERGTLETLFVQPVPGVSVVLGKFLAVLVTSLAAVVLNLLSMAGALALGLAPTGGGGMEFHMPTPMAMATTLILITPLAVLTSAILLAVSTYARTFRQAQMFLLPVTLVATLPALLAALPDIHLSPAVAVIPIANTALAIRDALVEEYRWGYLAIVFISTALYAGVSLRWVAGLLSREDLRLGLAAPEYSIRTAMARSRRGLAFGAIMVLLTYYGGSALQRPDGALGTWGGLAVTLWVLVLFPTVIYLLIFRLPKRDTLGLSWPGARNLVGAVFMVPAAVLLIVPYMTLQDLVLPFPEGLLEEMEKVFGATELHPLVALFLMAVSPAICEELLWRGAVQGELEEEGRPMKTILWVGILFGLFHLSIYRLVPTACLGFLLAYLRLASGSILPCMLFHGLYNAVMFLMSRNGNDELLESAGRLEPALLGAFLMVVIARWLWAGKRPARRPGDPN